MEQIYHFRLTGIKIRVFFFHSIFQIGKELIGCIGTGFLSMVSKISGAMINLDLNVTADEDTLVSESAPQIKSEQ